MQLKSNLMKHGPGTGVFHLCDMPEIPEGFIMQDVNLRNPSLDHHWGLQYGILSAVKAVNRESPLLMPVLDQVTHSPDAWMEFLGSIVDYYSVKNDRPISDHDAYLLVFSELMCGGMKDWLNFIDTGVLDKYPAFSDPTAARPIQNREKTQGGRYWSRPPQLAKLCIEFRKFKALLAGANESLEIEGLSEDAHPYVKEMTIVSTVLKAVATALFIEAGHFLLASSIDAHDIQISPYWICFNSKGKCCATLLDQWNQALDSAEDIFQGVQFRNGSCAPKTLRIAGRSPLASYLGLVGSKRKVKVDA